MPQYDIISAGLMVMDVIATGVDRTVFDRDTTYAERIQYVPGGDALNVAINLSKLSVGVAIAGNVGQDASGGTILQHLQGLGIHTHLVRQLKDTATATSIVLSRPDAERHFIYQAGANDLFDGSQLTDDMLARAKILYIGSVLGLPALEDTHLPALLQRARALGLKTVMDACATREMSQVERIWQAFPHVDVFFPSWAEAVVLTGADTPEEAARQFTDRGVGLAGVKLGADGVYLYDGHKGLHLPAIPFENPVDTTGAGDAFMSGFLLGMLQGEPVERCARMGTVMGHCCIQTYGATTHSCTLASVQQMMGSA